MKKYIQKQINRNSSKNLLFAKVEEITQTDDGFLAFLLSRKQNNRPLTKDILEYTVDQSLAAIYQINQYIEVSKDDTEALKEIYRSTYERLNFIEEKKALTEHHRMLGQWLARLYPEHFIEPLSKRRTIGGVINRQYSVELQMDVLHLYGRELMEPVIDIGCGPSCNLASLLRKSCRNVHCLDRQLAISNEKNHKMSWFEFTFEKDYWGTIISNMSFSNHFLYTLHNRTEHVERYMAKYLEILDSLKMHGTFMYAPGIPFVEDNVDDSRFRVKRCAALGDLNVTEITRISV